MDDTEAFVDLLWIPLGAGGHVVRVCGRLYERLVSAAAGRPRADLYHSALVVHLPEGRYVVEQAPVPGGNARARGAVAGGPVGFRAAGRLRLFRYEVRCWRDGVIPDAAEAVGPPVRLTDDVEAARRLLDLVPQVPTPVWGRDEFGAGEMWNSNAIVAWLVETAGLDTLGVAPPDGGRAPGWHAGVVVARRRSPAHPASPDVPSPRSWNPQRSWISRP